MCVIVVAHHNDTMQAGACRAAAGKLVEHLSGSARSNDGGRWPIVVDPSDKSCDDPLPLSAAEWEAEKRRQWQDASRARCLKQAASNNNVFLVEREGLQAHCQRVKEVRTQKIELVLFR